MRLKLWTLGNSAERRTISQDKNIGIYRERGLESRPMDNYVIEKCIFLCRSKSFQMFCLFVSSIMVFQYMDPWDKVMF